MSFHEDLTLSVWPKDLAESGIVRDEKAVYTGRRRQNVTRQDAEIWLEVDTLESLGTGLHGLTRYPYLVHVIQKGNTGGKQTGDTMMNQVRNRIEAIRDRYHGSNVFGTKLPRLVHVEVQGDTVDEDPDEKGVVEGIARVVFTVRS